MINREKDDESGLSVLVGYALNIFVAAVLIGIITISTSGAIDNTERNSMNKMSYVISSDLAYQIEKVDRISNNQNMNISYRVSVPDTSYNYVVSVENNYIIVDHEKGSVSMPLNTNYSVSSFELQSGDNKIIEVIQNENEIRER